MDADHETVFEFNESVAVADIEDTLEVATAALDGVVGAAAVRLEAAHEFDAVARVVRIDATQPAGRALARAFLEVATRSLGERAIRIVRCGRACPSGAAG